jgi:signal transduction histidine kinase/DNA-binding response OmpR family regulator
MNFPGRDHTVSLTGFTIDMASITRILNKATQSSFGRLSLIHLIMALLIFVLLLFQLIASGKYQYLIFCFLLLQFMVFQLYALRLSIIPEKKGVAICLVIGSLSFSVLVLPVLLSSSLFVGLTLLATVPLFTVATDQLKRLPSILFFTFVISALSILIDLVSPWTVLRLQVDIHTLLLSTGAGLCLYLCCVVSVFLKQFRSLKKPRYLRINLATQYALVMSGISATVIILVTSVLITQIRNSQIDQVGKNFQTIADNFAKLAGSHLEQEMQKLQLLAQQVPILTQSLTEANMSYTGDRKAAQKILTAKNRLWQKPKLNENFIMNYLNSPIIEALSRFRGHNSFHNDILFVDGYGGLVASLGQKPDRFYFYDQHWWQVCWNNGLGNIFIGDLELDSSSKIPKLRIAIDIIDHTSNKVIGMLSSRYLLRTLIEDIGRLRPESVDQISLINAQGEIICSTSKEISNNPHWPQLLDLTYWTEKPTSGWELGKDQTDQTSLIGLSSISTAYNVISDPLHRLGWHIVVSGSISKALSEVNQSTKLALLVGLVAMALGVLGAMAAARVITRPIENLTATASAMNSGNLDNRAELAGPEELVALAEGFNTLTNQLNKTINNLTSNTVQLERAKSEAETATKLKGEFLANMSHEIRTPLNAILGFADILVSTLHDNTQKGYAKIIKTSGADLLHLINEILDLSKIEAGRMEIKKSAMDIRRLFDSLARIFSISAETKNITLAMEIAAEIPTSLMLDATRLKQVLFNLIGNAVKFTEQGSVHFSAKATAGDMPHLLDLTIVVRDTGIGIDPKNFTDIFKTFHQYSDDLNTSIEGTGLGLTISKNLVEMMGGTLRVDGALNKGTTFTIHFPGVRIANDNMAESEGPLVSHPHTQQIEFDPASLLMVDDLEVNRQLLIENLKNFPLKISEATNGTEALQLTKEQSYDLIMMDLRMPDMDGYKALKAIRKDIRNKSIPIIAITSSGMKEEIVKIVATGFDAYLIRPFSPKALIELLAQFLPYHSEEKSSTYKEAATPVLQQHSTKPKQWTCSPEADEYLLKTIKREWTRVIAQQSIPEIRFFASKVETAGELYQVDLLSQYGQELSGAADAFDIGKVEKLLKEFEDIMACRRVEKA